MEKLAYFMLTFSILLFFVSIAGIYFSDRGIYEESFYASVNVTDISGFDLNGTALTFGNIQLDGSSTRNIIFENKNSFPVEVLINVEGDIEQLMHFENKIKAEAGERKKISFSVIAFNVSERFYSGNVTFKIVGLSE